MKSSIHRIKLTRSEIDYLKSVHFLPQALLECLRDILQRPYADGTVEFSSVRAEEFREAFTEQLAKVGFDETYELTAEGHLLEELIDRFHAGHDDP